MAAQLLEHRGATRRPFQQSFNFLIGKTAYVKLHRHHLEPASEKGLNLRKDQRNGSGDAAGETNLNATRSTEFNEFQASCKKSSFSLREIKGKKIQKENKIVFSSN